MATISIPRRRPLTLSLPRVTSEGVIYVSVFLVVANLVLIPLALVLLEAFNLGPIHSVAGGATLNNFVIAWSSPVTHAVLWNTVVFAVCSTILTTTIGVFFAFMIERTDMPMKNFAYAIVPLTIAMPGLLYGIAWVLLLSPRIGLFNLGLMGLFGQQNGLFTSWAGIGLTEPPIQPYSMAGMIFVDAIRGVGVVFLMTVGIFRNMDPSLEEAAQVSGARARTVANRITLRLMMPGILAAFIYSLTGNLETFDIPAIMGLPAGIHLLSTKIYLLTTTDDHGIASALGVMFLLIAVVMVFWYGRVTRRVEQFSTVTGKGYRPRVMQIGRFRFVAAGLVWVYLLVVVVAPFFVLLWASILPSYRIPSVQALQFITFDAYKFVFTNPQGLNAIKNTLLLTLVAPIVCMLLAALVSWFAVRSKMPGRRWLDVLAFIPHAVPSIMIALAMIYLFLTVPWRLIPIYGTIWIISLAIVTRYLAFGSRMMHGAVLQIHKDLSEAALVGGVTWPTAFRYIVLPLLFPAMIAGWVFVALHALRELSMALLLYSPDARVMSLLMWDSWQSGHVPVASATGVILMAGIAILIGIGRFLDQRRIRRSGGV